MRCWKYNVKIYENKETIFVKLHQRKEAKNLNEVEKRKSLDINSEWGQRNLFKTQVLLLFFYIFKLIYVWLHGFFVAAHGLSLVAVSGGCSLAVVGGFSSQWLLSLQCTRSAVWAQESQHTRLVGLGHVKSSQTRDHTHVPFIGSEFFTTGPPKFCFKAWGDEIQVPTIY